MPAHVKTWLWERGLTLLGLSYPKWETNGGKKVRGNALRYPADAERLSAVPLRLAALYCESQEGSYWHKHFIGGYCVRTSARLCANATSISLDAQRALSMSMVDPWGTACQCDTRAVLDLTACTVRRVTIAKPERYACL